MKHQLRAIGVLAAGLALVATTMAPAGAARAAGKSNVRGKVTVFAATSLPAAFKQIARGFHKKYPDASVKFRFEASGALAEEIQQGAAADVFAPADEDSMLAVEDEISGKAAVFAHNQLEIAVQPGNPKQIETLADLAAPDVDVALCAEDTGCGQYTDEALQRANVEIEHAFREPDVPSTLGQVQSGACDAAIVYVTDVKAAKNVIGVEIPDAQNVVATYPIATLADARNPKAAKAFVAYVLSRAGQATLRDFGFLPR
jgi:molybdate transport system substrate-binding protein